MGNICNSSKKNKKFKKEESIKIKKTLNFSNEETVTSFQNIQKIYIIDPKIIGEYK